MVRNCAPENLEIPGLVLTHHPGMTVGGCPTTPAPEYALLPPAARGSTRRAALGESAMTLGTILIIILVIFLLGGFSGRFRGYGYGYGHSGMGLVGVILIILLILVLLGKL